MASIRRKISSRMNGAKSKGPVTSAGKARSAQNSLVHGLLAGHSVLQTESKDAFEELYNQYVASFNPQIPVEMDMIEEMTSAYWRMRRLWAMETKMMDNQIELQTTGDPMTRITDSFSALCETSKFSVLNRYEVKLHRIYQRSLRNLLLLRNLPLQPEESEDETLAE
jgi:hypothetical protein